jgi:hypothetical protein
VEEKLIERENVRIRVAEEEQSTRSKMDKQVEYVLNM